MRTRPVEQAIKMADRSDLQNARTVYIRSNLDGKKSNDLDEMAWDHKAAMSATMARPRVPRERLLREGVARAQ